MVASVSSGVVVVVPAVVLDALASTHHQSMQPLRLKMRNRISCSLNRFMQRDLTDFSSVNVACGDLFLKEQLNRLTICFLCILTICNFSYFVFWF